MNATTIGRLNPLTKIAISFLITISALLISDPKILALVISLQLASIPFLGVALRTVLIRLSAVLTFAVGVVVLNTVASQRGGELLVSILGIDIRSDAAIAGLTAGLRVIVIILPSALLMATITAPALAEALAQQLRLPQRFVLAALAAVRLVDALRDEVRLIGQAQRSRGLANESFIGKVRGFASLVFLLLVSALRRAERLATAMESRGLSTAPRTWLRASRFTPKDGLAFLLVLTLSVAAPVLTRG
jgi:energy-coupling factor transporter transmembrane protein EcfT